MLFFFVPPEVGVQRFRSDPPLPHARNLDRAQNCERGVLSCEL